LTRAALFFNRENLMRKLILAIALLLPVCAFGQIQFNEDDPEQSPQTGPLCLSVRRDTAATSAGTTGDYATLNTDASGKLWVNAAGTGAAGEITKLEDAAHTSGDSGVMALGVQNVNLGSTLCVSDKDYCPIAVSGAGGVYVIGNVQEDLASGAAHPLNPIAIIRDDALVAATETNADGDYTFARADNYGALWSHPITSTTVLTDTAVIEAAAYDANDCIMAAAESLTGVAATAPFLTGRITDVVVTDLAGQGANLELYIFSADPGAVCAAINSDLDIADDDLAKVQAVIPITTHFSGADNSISTATNLNQKYTLASGTTLYYALISRGTPTYAGTSDLVISIKVELD